jgi:hypothetical protein
MRESMIETYLVKRVEELGGFCEKFSSPNRRNVPDRIVTFADNRLAFVECKASGKRPTQAQMRDHERRRSMGFDVYVVNSYESADLVVGYIYD